MRDDTTRQGVLFKSLPGKPVVAKFDQAHSSSDGGALLLKACDAKLGLIGNRHADLLFNIVYRRYELKATIVTTNRPFAEWGEVFPNAACVVSIVDRLVHHSEIIVIEGESYRMREAKERAGKKKQRAKSRRATGRKDTPKTPA